MEITIRMKLDDDLADPDHSMGVTEAGHEAIQEALGEFGTEIVVSRT